MLFVLDLETTGLQPWNACVWQLACVAVEGGAIAAEFETKVRPSLDFFQEEHREVVRTVSGLDDAGLLALIDAPPADEACYRWWRWTWDLWGNPFMRRVTAFNVEFDRRFFERMLRCKTWDGRSIFCGFNELQWQPCLMDAAARAMELPPRNGGAYRVKLSAACEHFNIDPGQPHDALADARAAAHLAIRLGIA